MIMAAASDGTSLEGPPARPERPNREIASADQAEKQAAPTGVELSQNNSAEVPAADEGSRNGASTTSERHDCEIAGLEPHDPEIEQPKPERADGFDHAQQLTEADADFSFFDKIRFKMKFKSGGWTPVSVGLALLMMMCGCTVAAYVVGLAVATTGTAAILASVLGTLLAMVGLCYAALRYVFKDRR
jgi:uncharacterized membrane protein YhdT